MRFVLVTLLGVRAWYARWALQYIPPLIDGKPNPDFDQLNSWVHDDRVSNFINKGRVA